MSEDGRVTRPREAEPRAAMTISQFARRSGLSHKALRLYEMSGLLPPAEIDPVNGYRRYSEGQLGRAHWISRLRQLDMPLATVAELLADGDEQQMLARLDRWWAEQQATMRIKEALVAHLRAGLAPGGAGDLPSYQVRVRKVAGAKIAVIRHQVDQSTLVDTMVGACQQIRDHLRDCGATPAGEAWWLYHGVVTPDSEAPVEACLPYTGSADPAGPITLRIEPAHREAYCTVSRDECAYPRIMAAYDAVASWVRTRQLVSTGPAREVYFAQWEQITGSDPFAHVAQPIQEEQ